MYSAVLHNAAQSFGLKSIKLKLTLKCLRVNRRVVRYRSQMNVSRECRIKLRFE
jgi:hypothetical protein